MKTCWLGLHKWEIVASRKGYAYTYILYKCKLCGDVHTNMISFLWEDEEIRGKTK